MKRKICEHRIKVEGLVMETLAYQCYEDAEAVAKKAAIRNPNKTVTIFAEVAQFMSTVNPPKLVQK